MKEEINIKPIKIETFNHFWFVYTCAKCGTQTMLWTFPSFPSVEKRCHVCQRFKKHKKELIADQKTPQ